MQNFGKKLVYAFLGVFAFIIIEYLTFYLINYYFYDAYEAYYSEDTYEEGKEFTASQKGTGELEAFTLAAEQDDLQLYINTETCVVAVVQKSTGDIVSTNPLDKKGGRFLNQMTVNYLKGSTSGNYQTVDSVDDGTYVLESIENGVRVIYTMGNTQPLNKTVPLALTNERMAELLGRMSAADAKAFDRFYYVEGHQNNSLGKGYRMLNDNMADGTSASLATAVAILERIGYTAEEYQADKKSTGVEETYKASFIIPLEYRLVNGSLEVNIPTTQIKEAGGGTITNIELLRFFGAATEEESGYAVVPNGSGSLINFNNGKGATNTYSQYVYGIDPLAADYNKVEFSEDARMPIWGMHFDEKSDLFAEITSGSSLAQIVCNTAGYSKLDYNMTFANFYLRGTEKMEMFGVGGSASTMAIAEDNLYQTNLTIRYSILPEEYDGYSDMAKFYREELIARGALTLDTEGGDIPFYMDLIGAVKETDFILGAQYLAVLPMTTFEQAESIVTDLQNAGITNQVVNYQGWMNGGYYHDVASRLKVVRQLGSKGDLEDLSAKLESIGGKLYADVAFQKVTYISKRYSETNESARYYSGGVIGAFGLVSPVNLRQTASLGYEENIYYLLSPKFLVRYVDKFVNKFEDYDVTGVSLRDLGSTLISDKKRTEFIDREYALDIVLGQFALIAEMEKDVMVNMANSYTWQYADDLLNVATSHNPYFMVDAEIPFYQMIIHGCIDYAGTSLNMGDDYNIAEDVLRMIEYGAAPHFTFTYEDSSEMKYTALNSSYATTFSVWKDDAVEVYQKVNEALKHVSGATMDEHETLQDGVKKVTYSNGVVFYINTTEAEVTVEGITIPALSYEMK